MKNCIIADFFFIIILLIAFLPFFFHFLFLMASEKSETDGWLKGFICEMCLVALFFTMIALSKMKMDKAIVVINEKFYNFITKNK